MRTPAAAAGPFGTTSTMDQRPATVDSATDIPSHPFGAAVAFAASGVTGTEAGACVAAGPLSVGAGFAKGRAIGSPIKMSLGWKLAGGRDGSSAERADDGRRHAAANAQPTHTRKLRTSRPAAPTSPRFSTTLLEGSHASSMVRESVRGTSGVFNERRSISDAGRIAGHARHSRLDGENRPVSAVRRVFGRPLARRRRLHRGHAQLVHDANATVERLVCVEAATASPTFRVSIRGGRSFFPAQCCHGLTALQALLYSRRLFGSVRIGDVKPRME